MGTATQSIDVGSMFLMDLSVGESELSGESSDITYTVDKELIFSSGYDSAKSTYQSKTHNDEIKSSTTNQATPSISLIAYQRQDSQRDYMSNSLDRLARVIGDNFDHQFEETGDGVGRSATALVTIVEPQAPPEILELQSTSSLSDESYNSSLSASYTASSDETGDELAVDRASATTREDSGVIDIRDLDSQLNYFYDDGEQQQQQEPGESELENRGKSPTDHEKPISKFSKATDLINTSTANNDHDHNNTTSSIMMKLPNRSNNEPTNNNNSDNNNECHLLNNHHRHHNHHHHHHHHHNHHHHQHHHDNHHLNHRTLLSKKSVSASLPIEVPARQMKRDLKKSKMTLMNKNLAANETVASGNSNLKKNSTTAYKSLGYQSTAGGCGADDDVDEFLEQEYNENHHNHYPIDEYPEERLRAEDNPMKLFESIQAMARSLHEDIELFGSLPPKRLLESPIWTANRDLGAGWA